MSMPQYRRCYNEGDTVQFQHKKTVKTGIILRWLLNEQRYRIQEVSGEIVWIQPSCILNKVAEFSIRLD